MLKKLFTSLGRICFELDNGWRLSVGNSNYHYCDNNDLLSSEPVKGFWSTTVEIAVLEDGEFLLENQVAGYIAVSILPEILTACDAGDIEKVEKLVEGGSH